MEATVSDGARNTVVTDFVTVRNSTPALISAVSDTIAIMNQEFRMVPPVLDNDHDLLDFALIDAPEGMTIARRSGIINWTPLEEGIYPVIFSVSDGESRTEIAFNVVVYPEDSDLLAPFGLVAFSGYAGCIPLFWNEPLMFEAVGVLPLRFSGYEVSRRIPGGEWETIATVYGLNYIDSSVEPEIAYFYKVRTVFTEMASVWSEKYLQQPVPKVPQTGCRPSHTMMPPLLTVLSVLMNTVMPCT